MQTSTKKNHQTGDRSAGFFEENTDKFVANRTNSRELGPEAR